MNRTSGVHSAFLFEALHADGCHRGMNGMKKILIIYSSRIPSVELVCNLMRIFRQETGVDVQEVQVIDCRASHIAWADTILAIRPFEGSAYGIVRAAKEAGKEIVVYLDDDLLHLPPVYSSRLRKFFTVAALERNCRYLTEILGFCDVLWGSSRFLLEKYRPLVRQGRCVRTDVAANLSRMRPVSPRGRDVRLLYAASGDHYAELNAYVIPALNELADKFPNLRLTCVGLRREALSDCRVPMEVVPWFSSYEEYYSFVLQQHFDIGVAPVRQEDFYRCKYFNKFIEYSILGMTGIYTKDEPYQAVVRDGVNGLLADNTAASWKEKIECALEDADEAQQMVARAQAYCLEHFSPGRQVEMLVRELPELYLEKGTDYGRVVFRPRYFLDHARKYANTLVGFYERGRH